MDYESIKPTSGSGEKQKKIGDTPGFRGETPGFRNRSENKDTSPRQVKAFNLDINFLNDQNVNSTNANKEEKKQFSEKMESLDQKLSSRLQNSQRQLVQ